MSAAEHPEFLRQLLIDRLDTLRMVLEKRAPLAIVENQVRLVTIGSEAYLEALRKAGDN